MKGKSKQLESASVANGSPQSPEITAEKLIKQPWYFWEEKDRCNVFLRHYLSNVLRHTIQLRLFRKYIQEEFNKKRSRKGASVRRAYRYSKNDANKLVESLNGFDLEQLWTILDKNTSTETSSLQKRLDHILQADLSKILKNDTDVTEDIPEEPSSSYSSESQENQDSESDSDSDVEDEEQPKETVGEDEFFNMEEMEAFADKDFESDGEGINYFDSLGEESDSSVAAADMKYTDFFKDTMEDSDGPEDEIKPLSCDSNLDLLDDDEKEMELLLQRVEDDGVTDDEDDKDEYRDDLGNDDFEEAKFGEEVYRDDLDEDMMEEVDQHSEISKIENELAAPKHWSLMGESIATKRPRNSLLDLDLELPQMSSTVYEKEKMEEQIGNGVDPEEPLPLELIIVQRIKSGIFDNVERKTAVEDQLEAIERLKKNNNVDIDFTKSSVGLGDIYAQKYKEQFLAIDKLDSHKKALTEQFAKLMYKLDSLTNSSFVPKRISESEKAAEVPTIAIETPLNVVTAIKTNDAEKSVNPAKISRNAKKRKFQNKLKGLVKSGKATVEQVNKIKTDLTQRNKRKQEDAKAKKTTGLTGREADKESKRSNRKVNITEMLSNIEKQ
ncbi:hypothetical protein BEWA_033140 [Theileria equi strain WA]|uniref:Uncharacterized protein n=1 Tax=Theileria equi strain WA TaxID=1537102 RepID=L0AZP0_THEEQ|nr:hypothetical protein BEWA_033140 [Theileria equi strain WA]AFZ80461.1 hypothetical protein BEWA_033140 [Theileria equi strain WA]|eukprot:XP_004830127.1 hypothetical protein BEWA_033140 [Theileria equi strain WA]